MVRSCEKALATYSIKDCSTSLENTEFCQMYIHLCFFLDQKTMTYFIKFQQIIPLIFRIAGQILYLLEIIENQIIATLYTYHSLQKWVSKDFYF